MLPPLSSSRTRTSDPSGATASRSAGNRLVSKRVIWPQTRFRPCLLSCAREYIGSTLRPIMGFPYRADQVGSLLRPATLLAARNDPAITRGQLEAIENTHILEVLKCQKEAGLKIFTDGELRRTSFMGDFYESVDGLDQEYEIARAWKGAPSGVAAAS